MRHTYCIYIVYCIYTYIQFYPKREVDQRLKTVHDNIISSRYMYIIMATIAQNTVFYKLKFTIRNL